MKIWTKSFSKQKRDVAEFKKKSIESKRPTPKKMLRWKMAMSQRRENKAATKRMQPFHSLSKYSLNLWSKRPCNKSMKLRCPIRRSESIPWRNRNWISRKLSSRKAWIENISTLKSGVASPRSSVDTLTRKKKCKLKMKMLPKMKGFTSQYI